MLTRVVRVLREHGLRGLVAAIGRRVMPPRQVPVPVLPVRDVSRLDGGVDVLGFFTAEHGVGEAARDLVATLHSANVPVCTVNYTDTESRMDHHFVTDDESRHRVLLCSINAEQMVASRGRLPLDFYEDRYVIGQWFWELEESPPWYEPAWPMVQEMWAPTRFIAAMLTKAAPSSVTITHVPLPVVQTPIDAFLGRPHFGLDDRFMFLFVFDMMSVMKRKNPIGLIDAYTRAFTENNGAHLVIKTMNGNKRPEDLAALTAAAAGRSDITVIDAYFSRTETSTLISLADCYVSLHRSEGLGLTLSEAVSHAVPVIATDYSGPTDFLHGDHAHLIPWDRVPVGEGAGGYSPTATWAEPRVDAAAEAMRRVHADPHAARAMAQRGQQAILSAFAPEVSGTIMRSRLEEIWSLNSGN